jgi:hypothetical protein
MRKLEPACHAFAGTMKGNRRNTNDGKMALNVLEDIKTGGKLKSKTRVQLLAWCHTNGGPYQRGVELAQAICLEVYGRIPAKEEQEE